MKRLFKVNVVKTAGQWPFPGPDARRRGTRTGQTIHIYPENSNCNVCPNSGQLSKFDAVHTQRLKFYTEL
jgi:hypothetical protein